jgi:hypothetical protein
MSCITEAKFKERTTGDRQDLVRRLGKLPALWNDDTRHDVSLFLSEDEFLDVIGTKVLRVFLLAIHSHLC